VQAAVLFISRQPPATSAGHRVQHGQVRSRTLRVADWCTAAYLTGQQLPRRSKGERRSGRDHAAGQSWLGTATLVARLAMLPATSSAHGTEPSARPFQGCMTTCALMG